MLYKDKQDLINRLISEGDTVLDVGFWGQGVNRDNPAWVHEILKKRGADVYGLDIDFDTKIFESSRYMKASAENFDFGLKFSVIFAGDLLEHLSNPGLFLDCSRKNLSKSGNLIITTPNAFNLFNLTEKLAKDEPTVNPEHTCYFNKKTLKQLFSRHDLIITDVSYIYTLHTNLQYKESWKKKILNILYYVLSKFTYKYIETIVVTAKIK